MQTVGHQQWNRTVSLLRTLRHPRPITFDAKPKPVEMDLARTALMIIDMQNDFLEINGWFATTRGANVAHFHPLYRKSTP